MQPARCWMLDVKFCLWSLLLDLPILVIVLDTTFLHCFAKCHSNWRTHLHVLNKHFFATDVRIIMDLLNVILMTYNNLHWWLNVIHSAVCFFYHIDTIGFIKRKKISFSTSWKHIEYRRWLRHDKHKVNLPRIYGL